MLNFIKCFFCVYWNDHVVFVFSFVDRVYHIDWLVYVEPSLQPWNESNLIMVYDSFYVLLDSVCYFFEDFRIYSHQRYWPVIFFFCNVFVWFWYQSDGGFIEWLWECPFPSVFWNGLRRMGINSSFNVW